ncbi:transcriptional regulator [Streptomyces sp. NPDC051016]|uniref:transcriptional regulator n=1 Tax=Streptomyces sp. NPDC051016 TaxID=3365638 RepID=UPI003796F2BE
MNGSELAYRAGPSKATLSQLEAAKGNPMIDPPDALRIPLTGLLTRDPDPGPVLVAGPDLAQAEVGRKPLYGISSGHSLEIRRLRTLAHTELPGAPHATGTAEHLLVATGRLTPAPTDAPLKLTASDLLAFAGDAPPIYRTESEPADVTVIIASPLVS